MSKILYQRNIDGLRAIAVLFVLFFHATPKYFSKGFIGVDIFFVISGYIITSLLLRDIANNDFSIRKFYFRRAKRILPSLLIILLFCLVVGWFLLFSNEYMEIAKHVIGSSLFASNFILINETGYFDKAIELKPLMHLWSLAIEEQFYIFFPIILWASIKFKKPVIMLACLILISFMLNIYFVNHDRSLAFYLPFTRIWELLSGALLAFFLFKYEWNITDKQKDIASLVGVSLFVLSLLIVSKKYFPGPGALLPSIATLLLIAAGENSIVSRRFLSTPILVGIGLISYPLYLWHWPLFSFYYIINSNNPPIFEIFIIIVISFALSYLTFEFIEKPIRYGKENIYIKSFCLILSLFLISAIAFYIYKNDGLEDRKTMKIYSNFVEQFKIPEKIDKSCLDYIKVPPIFNYCKKTTGTTDTIALIGDSHAFASFEGIADKLLNLGIGAVALANSSCPPFVGLVQGEIEEEKSYCTKRINQIIDVILSKSEISKVIIFSRGETYFTGKNLNNNVVSKKTLTEPQNFLESLQRTIDILNKAGKKVYYVLENPELPFDPLSCTKRPLKTNISDCILTKKEVLKEQERYLLLISKLRNVTIVDTIDKFCPDDLCIILKNNMPFYRDNNHLSKEGGKFQAEHIIKSLFLD